MDSIIYALEIWKKYWGDAWWFAPFALICAVYLIFFEKKKIKWFLGGGIFIFLFIFFFPYTGKILQKFGDSSVYWRLLWVFPGAIVIACAFTSLIVRIPVRIAGFVLFILLNAAIVFSGTNVFRPENFETKQNKEKVPQMIVEIADIINQDRGEEDDTLVACTEYAAVFLRIYDPTLKMPYGRERRGCINGRAKLLYECIQSPGSERIEEENYYVEMLGVDYILKYLYIDTELDVYARYGYECIGKVNDVYILRKDRNVL